MQGSEAIAVYFASAGLKDFARTYDLTTDQAKTLLDGLGVEFLKSVEEQRSRGRSLREIAKTHGIQPSKLSHWMKQDGFEVKRGNHATIDEKKLVAVYRKTNSGQKAADAVGVSWSTATDRLKLLGEWKG